MKKRWLTGGSQIALVFLFAMCGTELVESAVATLDGRLPLPGAAGSGPFETVKDWISVFHAKFPEVKLSISSVGSGAAQSALWGDINCDQKPIEPFCNRDPNGTMSQIDGSTLWGIGGGEMTTETVAEHGEQGLKQLPALSGPVLVSYSKDVTGDLGSKTSTQLNLPGDVVAGIFNSSILYWNDPVIRAANPHLPNLPSERISVIVRADKSGMTETLTSFLHKTHPTSWPKDAVGKLPEWSLPNLSLSSETSAVCSSGNNISKNFQAIGQTGVGIGLLRRPYSVSYLELGYFSTLTQFVAQAHVSSTAKPDTFVSASIDTIRTTMDGLAGALEESDNMFLDLVNEETPIGGYPISRFASWYIKTSPNEYESCSEAWHLYRFIEWTYTNDVAGTIALGNGWVVPPSSIVSKALEVLRQIQCIVADDEADGVLRAGDVILAVDFTPVALRKAQSVSQALLLSCLAVIFAIIGSAVYLFSEHKRRMLDAVWKVNPDELKFDEPRVIVGRGTFGLVLLAEYRGTKIAVKRVIPPRPKHRLESPSSSIEITSGFNSESFSQDLAIGNERASDAKKVRRQAKHERLKKNFLKEIRYLSKLRHPCITTVMGAVVTSGHEPLLVMEYMDHGSLYDILHNSTAPIDGDMLLPMLLDVAQGLRFLHSASANAVHGDLKAQNILVDSKFRCKLADFGLSAKSSVTRGRPRGTSYWMAPELLTGKSSNTAASDMYSLGVILYEMYSRKDPYDGENDESLILQDIVDPAINKRPQTPPGCPPDIRSMMRECWNTDPAARPTAEEIDTRLKRMDVTSVEPHYMKQSSQRLKASRNERLLDEVFPRHVAEALRDGRKVEPQSHDQVSIFFSDIVGFTSITATVSLDKISNMLDRLYNKLDNLSYKHDVMKLETVGDAYIAVTNLAKKQEADHVKRIAEFALDAIQAAKETPIDLDDPSKGNLELRAGFHTGPAISNVVGSRLPKFSIFGDAMNTASRMEAHSLTGRVQCSDHSATLLMKQCPSVDLCCRGEIEIKGKGTMTTFWVNGFLSVEAGT